MKASFRLQKFVSLAIFFCLFFSLELQSQTTCKTIDFEKVVNDSLYEGLDIDLQFEDSCITFQLEDGTSPKLAKVGFPTAAFGGPYGGDTIDVNQGIDLGLYFLTDDGYLSGLTTQPLIISFSSAVDSVSGHILDIDFDESYIIQVRDQLDSVLVADTISASIVDPAATDGLATSWGFMRNQADIYSVKLIGSRTSAGSFGLGFDNFVFCSACKTSAVKETLAYPVVVSPNPSNGNFKVDLQDRSITALTLYDVSGRGIAHNVVYNNSSAHIECGYKGIVLLKITSDMETAVKKILLH